jgi:hypothetical protein
MIQVHTAASEFSVIGAWQGLLVTGKKKKKKKGSIMK